MILPKRPPFFFHKEATASNLVMLKVPEIVKEAASGFFCIASKIGEQVHFANHLLK
jgi:hypothetical protein